MDEISNKYKAEAQNQLNWIAESSATFNAACKKLKDATEQKILEIDKIDPIREDKTNRLKLKLKQDLAKLLVQFEKDQKNSFLDGIIKLEDIYHEKEKRRMKEIEEELISM
jgi:hypothetical protein